MTLDSVCMRRLCLVARLALCLGCALADLWLVVVVWCTRGPLCQGTVVLKENPLRVSTPPVALCQGTSVVAHSKRESQCEIVYVVDCALAWLAAVLVVHSLH